jgi:hemerythrin
MEYVITHFGNEEKLMDEFAYPDSAEHKEQHKYFMRKMVALREDLQTNGPSVSLVINTNQTILRWLIDHIKKVDLRLGAFLKSRS